MHLLTSWCATCPNSLHNQIQVYYDEIRRLSNNTMDLRGITLDEAQQLPVFLDGECYALVWIRSGRRVQMAHRLSFCPPIPT